MSAVTINTWVSVGSLVVVLLTIGGLVIRQGRSLEQRLERRIDKFEQRTDSRFDSLEHRTDSRFDKLEAKYDRLDARYDQLDAKLDAKYDQLDAKYDQLDAKYDESRGEVARAVDRLRTEFKDEITRTRIELVAYVMRISDRLQQLDDRIFRLATGSPQQAQEVEDPAGRQ